MRSLRPCSTLALRANGLASSSIRCFAGKSEAIPDSLLAPEERQDLPTITEPGSAFKGDLRSSSGLGLGDGITSHTAKWMQGKGKSPMEWIQEAKPIKVSGTIVASYGGGDPGLGCPVEYITLIGTSKEKPAVCKYTGNKYYSEDWMFPQH